MKKILLLIASAIIITLLMPNRALLDINVHKGEVWNDATLVAPFDIPILKSQTAIDDEKHQLINDFQPIFKLDTITSNRNVTRLIANLRQSKDISKATLDTISQFLHRAYTIGVIPAAEYLKYGDKIVRISNRNEISAMPMLELFTPDDIDEFLTARNVDTKHVSDFIMPNLSYSDKLNKEMRNDELKSISSTRSMVRTGEVIVATGQLVDEAVFQTLSSFNIEYEVRVGNSSGIYVVMFGRFMLVLILLTINYLYCTSFAYHYFGIEASPWVFVMMLYVVMSALVALAVNLSGVSPYIVPLPIVAIYLMNYFNMRVAILGNLSVAIIGTMFVRIPFDFFIINFMAGMVAIYMMRHHYHRNNLFQAIGAIFATQVIVYISVSLLREADFTSINYIVILWFLVNVFLILGFYQAVYLIERAFGFVSDVTLLELCDTNQPLLMHLAEKAPGTFQHSVQVANLAEAAAKEIGANPLLARTGAMYHDIGKMENPFYFAENLSGEFNPHNDMTPLESAQMIRRHVTDGLQIAIKNRLPKQIIDFIEGHHGTSKMYFFYAAQLEKFKVVEDEKMFSYPGPRPVTKEVAICMMADAIEAASRSLKSYEKEPLEALVDKIIDIQISEHQLSDCELSFREVEQIKALFKAKLNTIYHVRISYPERK